MATEDTVPEGFPEPTDYMGCYYEGFDGTVLFCGCHDPYWSVHSINPIGYWDRDNGYRSTAQILGDRQ